MERIDFLGKGAAALVLLLVVSAVPAMAQTVGNAPPGAAAVSPAPFGGAYVGDGMSPYFDGYGCVMPEWTCSVGSVFLHRSNAQAAPLVEDGVSGAELVNVTDLDLGVGVGPRVEFGWRLAPNWEVGVEYFSVQGWKARQSLADPGNLRVPLLSNDPADYFDTISATYGSQLYSTDFVARWHYSDRIAITSGFRWVELHELVNSVADGVLCDGVASLRTSNYLYGYQLGGEVVLWDCGGPLQVEFVGKAGIYRNFYRASLMAEGSGVSERYRDKDDRISFLGQIGLKARYRLTENLSAFGGYEAMWLDGVALAPNFAAAYEHSDYGVVRDGHAFYHGALTGLEWNW